MTFDIGGVEDVPNGRPDLLECGDKETSHGIWHQSQHALWRPSDVLVPVLTDGTLHLAALCHTKCVSQLITVYV